MLDQRFVQNHSFQSWCAGLRLCIVGYTPSEQSAFASISSLSATEDSDRAVEELLATPKKIVEYVEGSLQTVANVTALATEELAERCSRLVASRKITLNFTNLLYTLLQRLVFDHFFGMLRELVSDRKFHKRLWLTCREKTLKESVGSILSYDLLPDDVWNGSIHAALEKHKSEQARYDQSLKRLHKNLQRQLQSNPKETSDLSLDKLEMIMLQEPGKCSRCIAFEATLAQNGLNPDLSPISLIQSEGLVKSQGFSLPIVPPTMKPASSSTIMSAIDGETSHTPAPWLRALYDDAYNMDLPCTPEDKKGTNAFESYDICIFCTQRDPPPTFEKAISKTGRNPYEACINMLNYLGKCTSPLDMLHCLKDVFDIAENTAKLYIFHNNRKKYDGTSSSCYVEKQEFLEIPQHLKNSVYVFIFLFFFLISILIMHFFSRSFVCSSGGR